MLDFGLDKEAGRLHEYFSLRFLADPARKEVSPAYSNSANTFTNTWINKLMGN